MERGESVAISADSEDRFQVQASGLGTGMMKPEWMLYAAQDATSSFSRIANEVELETSSSRLSAVSFMESRY